MVTHTLRHDRQIALSPSRWLVVGFVAGALSVLVFHQGAAALLHAIGMTAHAPYSANPTAPFGVPQVLSLAFWGGVWGVALAAAFVRASGARLLIGAAIFGAIAPTLVAWLVVAPLKGQPIAAGFAPMAMLVGPIVNAAWGLGTGIGLALFGDTRGRTHSGAGTT